MNSNSKTSAYTFLRYSIHSSRIGLQPYYFLIFLFLLSYSCTTTDPSTYVSHMNGYWEIEKVKHSDGTEKIYTYNQNVDFFEVGDSLGIRKKVQPQFDGRFKTAPDKITFSYAIENDSLRLYFKSANDTWKETVILAKENQIILKNETGNLYFYKPYQKLDL